MKKKCSSCAPSKSDVGRSADSSRRVAPEQGRPGGDFDFKCARHGWSQAALADRDFRIATFGSQSGSHAVLALQHSSVR